MAKMINFTVGPVQSEKNVLKIGGEQIPYFRTPEFSKTMETNEKLILKLVNAPKKSRAAFMTCSGTGGMEATIINTLNSKDKVLVVNGGSFGNRFIELLKIHRIKYSEIKLKPGETLTKNHLTKYKSRDFTAFVINAHETSTGVHYDLDLISRFCKENHLLLIVDAISSFLADELDMSKFSIDAIIIGSQKALACPPGVSIIALSSRAIKTIYNNKPKCMYLDLKLALTNGERGQTPFTPAVGILLQINRRLKDLDKKGGAISEIKRIKKLALYFRNNIKNLPFKIYGNSLSNAVTPLTPIGNVSAYKIFTILKDEYNIWICPNGGQLKDKVFRVGHLGDLNKTDYDKLIAALRDMQKRKII